MLRWNKQMHQYESDESLEKTIEKFDRMCISFK